MQVVYEADPSSHPIYHVQIQKADGTWVFTYRTTDAEILRSWRHTDAEHYASQYADIMAARGYKARVVRRTPDESLDAAIEVALATEVE